jgi:hypothetical protein
MTNETIIESGMEFIVEPKDHFFHIEQSHTYKSIQPHGVKIAEFIILHFDKKKNPAIWIVEAKSSAPNPDNTEDFDQYLKNLSEKFTNTLILFLAIYVKRHHSWAELPESFHKVSLESTNFRFILIINEYPDDWTEQVKRLVEQSKYMKSLVKTWKLSEVVVMNDQMARDQKLIR